MTDAPGPVPPLVEFDDAELVDGVGGYTARLRVSDHLAADIGAVSLIVDDEEDTSAVWLDESRAQLLVNALVAHFGLEVATAERLRADDARDEALAEKSDAQLGH